MRKYLANLILWVDIGLNVIFMSGSPYETISSRVGKQADRNVPWACKFCKVLSRLLGPEHCKQSEVPDYGKSFQWWKL